MVIPTNIETYLIVNLSDFILDFAFTINGLNASPTEQGQKLVENLLKDKLYTADKVWSFLGNHCDAINSEIPSKQVPFKVILSLIA